MTTVKNIIVWKAALLTALIAILIGLVYRAVVIVSRTATPETLSLDSASKPLQIPPRVREALLALGYVSWDDLADTQLSGVVKHDSQKSWSGYNLYTNDVNEAYIMDMSGKKVHTWSLPSNLNHCDYFELLPDGDIAISCVLKAFIRVRWDSTVRWIANIPAHHDVDVLDDGSFRVVYRDVGVSYRAHGRVYFDGVAHVSRDGEVVGRWSSYRNLSLLQQFHPPTYLDRAEPLPTVLADHVVERFDYYHLNSVETLKTVPNLSHDTRFQAGNLLLCLRNASLIVILDPSENKVTWHYGPGVLDFPHMPTMLENGNILIFDNGTLRGFSRVVEIDPLTKSVVWEYKAPSPEQFFSEWRGSAQRLPNGNTLICEAERGHVFEVTPEGEIVWDFWNPEIKTNKRKRIYRMMRVSEEQVTPLLRNG